MPLMALEISLHFYLLPKLVIYAALQVEKLNAYADNMLLLFNQEHTWVLVDIFQNVIIAKKGYNYEWVLLNIDFQGQSTYAPEYYSI